MGKGKAKAPAKATKVAKVPAKAAKAEGKKRWDMYGWVGNGAIKLRVGNVTHKEAKKAKEKWLQKSPKHGAFIVLHEHAPKLEGLTGKPKTKAKAKGKK